MVVFVVVVFVVAVFVVVVLVVGTASWVVETATHLPLTTMSVEREQAAQSPVVLQAVHSCDSAAELQHRPPLHEPLLHWLPRLQTAPSLLFSSHLPAIIMYLSVVQAAQLPYTSQALHSDGAPDGPQHRFPLHTFDEQLLLSSHASPWDAFGIAMHNPFKS